MTTEIQAAEYQVWRVHKSAYFRRNQWVERLTRSFWIRSSFESVLPPAELEPRLMEIVFSNVPDYADKNPEVVFVLVRRDGLGFRVEFKFTLKETWTTVKIE